MRIDQLVGARLDLWVAIANGVKRGPDGGAHPPGHFCYVYWHDAPQNQPDAQARLVSPGIDQRVQRFSTDWAHGGPVIERERIWIGKYRRDDQWSACLGTGDYDSFVPGRASYCTGPTPLIAAMRCWVASRCARVVDGEYHPGVADE